MSAYAELHAHSGFSFLDGSSDPEELVAEAVRLELSALALTDHNGFYGVVRFAEAARALGLPTVFGAEVTLSPAGPRTGEPDPAGAHLVVLAKNPEGYARLAAVLADAHLAGKRRVARCSRSTSSANATGGLARAHRVPQGHRARCPPRLGPLGGEARARPPPRGLRDGRRRRRAVGPRRPARHGAQRRAGPARCRGRGPNRCHQQRPLRHAGRLPAGHHPCRRAGTAPLAELEGWLPSGPAACLRSGDEQRRRFARWPGAVDQAAELGAACAFDLRLVAPKLPDFPVPEGSTSAATCATWSTRGPGPLRPEG